MAQCGQNFYLWLDTHTHTNRVLVKSKIKILLKVLNLEKVFSGEWILNGGYFLKKRPKICWLKESFIFSHSRPLFILKGYKYEIYSWFEGNWLNLFLWLIAMLICYILEVFYAYARSNIVERAVRYCENFETFILFVVCIFLFVLIQSFAGSVPYIFRDKIYFTVFLEYFVYCSFKQISEDIFLCYLI